MVRLAPGRPAAGPPRGTTGHVTPGTSSEVSMVRTLFQFLVVALVGAALLALAHVVAPAVAAQQPVLARLQANVNFQRTFLSVAVCILLLMPTYWLFVLHR